MADEDPSRRAVLARDLDDHVRAKASLFDPTQPGLLGKQAEPVGLVGPVQLAVRVAKHERVVHGDPAVVGIGVPAPLQEARAAAVGTATTSAVVTGIVSIVMATAILTVIFNALGI